ncbi:hypothetical protein GYMLUDRAFT_53041 [Collybiopsis luxurians FD-317 M1]|nr:hypothetical protein GYMLUDRAFT_53041 [Collybiopsis luxurians FD-317 M1]
MPSQSYSVDRIPYPPRQDHVSKYTSIRLLALTTNPECYSSTVEQELAFSVDQWRERIDNTDRVTFIATTAASSSSVPALDDDSATWVGIVTLLTPEFLEKESDNLPAKFRKFGKWSGSSHILVSMWVHPEHRRRGVGKVLMDAAVEWAKKDAPQWNAIVLEVLDTNRGAAALYKQMGFEDIEQVPPGTWMGKRIG